MRFFSKKMLFFKRLPLFLRPQMYVSEKNPPEKKLAKSLILDVRARFRTLFLRLSNI